MSTAALPEDRAGRETPCCGGKHTGTPVRPPLGTSWPGGARLASHQEPRSPCGTQQRCFSEGFPCEQGAGRELSSAAASPRSTWHCFSLLTPGRDRKVVGGLGKQKSPRWASHGPYVCMLWFYYLAFSTGWILRLLQSIP